MVFNLRELVLCDNMDIRLDIRLEYNSKQDGLEDGNCFLMLHRPDNDFSSEAKEVFLDRDGQVSGIHKRFAPDLIEDYKKLLSKKARLVVVFEDQ
jgi:hypothetical protein